MDFSRFDFINSRRIKQFINEYKDCKVTCDSRIMFIINRYFEIDPSLQSKFRNMIVRNFDMTFKFNETEKYVVLIFPDIQLIKYIIAKNAEIIQETNVKPSITIMLLPHLTELIAAYLMDEDLYYPSAEICLYGKTSKTDKPESNIKVESLNINLIPLDSDIVTMITENYLSRLWAFNELTAISEINACLDAISTNCEGFASVTAIGDKSGICAKHLSDISPTATTHLILIDRTADYITPLLTQSGIEGVIAELYGIIYGTTSFIDNSDQSSGQLFHIFNSQYDPLYPEFRLLSNREFVKKCNEYHEIVEQTLRSNTDKNIQAKRDDFIYASEKFKQIHKSLRSYESLSRHIIIESRQNPFRREVQEQEFLMIKQSEKGGKAHNQIEDKLFLYGADFRYIARILCLEYQLNPLDNDKSIVRRYESLVQRIYANYGLQQIPFLMRLKQMGLLSPEPQKTVTFKTLCQEYGLIDEEGNMYDGYVPLTTRLVNKIIKGEIEQMKKTLSQKNISFTQFGRFDPNDSIIVGFVGGCTHSEVNSMRTMSKKLKVKMNFFTTRVYTPNEFMDDIASGIPGWESVIEAVPIRVLHL